MRLRTQDLPKLAGPFLEKCRHASRAAKDRKLLGSRMSDETDRDMLMGEDCKEVRDLRQGSSE